MFKKFRGANLALGKVKSKLHPKQVIPRSSWILKEGDYVSVLHGNNGIKGKQGIISKCLYEKNKVVVEGVNLKVLTVQPNLMYPKGGKVVQETPLHYSALGLLDPQTKEPVKAHRKGKDRINSLTKEVIPWPEKKDDEEETGPLTTNRADALAGSFTPSLVDPPFPAPLLNELERMRRKNKERAIL